jgi:predicted dehydrogenase
LAVRLRRHRADAKYGTKDCAACQAGKDVYLQKPETLTLREGPLMIAAARRYGRVVSGGSQRVLDDYHGIVDPCWAGEIGTIKSLDIAVGGPSMPCYLPAQPTPPDMDWDLWLGPAPWEPYNSGRCDGNYGTSGGSWRSYIDYSGGSLTDWGAHHFGGAIFAADLRELQPKSVTYHPATADGKAGAYVTLAYPNGVEIHHNRPGHLQTVPPSLTHGGAIKIVGDGQPKTGKPVPLYRTPDGSGQTNIYGDFIECVKTRARPFRPRLGG